MLIKQISQSYCQSVFLPLVYFFSFFLFFCLYTDMQTLLGTEYWLHIRTKTGQQFPDKSTTFYSCLHDNILSYNYN